MKVYITKYALTKGILEREGEEQPGGYARAKVGIFTNFFNSREWYSTKQGAVKDAAQRRDRKIASLQKQIAKLEKLKF